MYREMFVLIVGGGRLGSQLALNLLEQGYKVRLLDNRPEILDRLHRMIPTEVVVVGDPTQPTALAAAGIETANVVAVVMPKDTQNLAIASFARFQFNVPRIIARVNEPRNAWLFTPEMGVDVALDQADILGSLIQEEMSLGDMMTLLKLHRGDYSVVEEKITEDAWAIGMEIRELDLPENCVIAAIIRKGKIVVPHGISALEAGDEVLAVTDRDGARQLELLFAPLKQD
jgi:trk system potassium uptake protein TrkA